jgi:hypothetical protein
MFDTGFLLRGGLAATYPNRAEIFGRGSPSALPSRRQRVNPLLGKGVR